MTDKTDDLTKTRFWAGLLMAVGGLLFLVAVVLAIYSSQVDVTTTVTGGDDPSTVAIESGTTTVDNARLPDALVTTTLGAGAVLLVAGAFYRRISKIVLTGVGEVDLNTEEKVVEKATAAAGGDPKKTAQIAAASLKKLRTQSVQVVDRYGLGGDGVYAIQPGAAHAAPPMADDSIIDEAVQRSTAELS